mgnify:CR=1 FL=1
MKSKASLLAAVYLWLFLFVRRIAQIEALEEIRLAIDSHETHIREKFNTYLPLIAKEAIYALGGNHPESDYIFHRQTMAFASPLANIAFSRNLSNPKLFRLQLDVNFTAMVTHIRKNNTRTVNYAASWIDDSIGDALVRSILEVKLSKGNPWGKLWNRIHIFQITMIFIMIFISV